MLTGWPPPTVRRVHSEVHCVGEGGAGMPLARSARTATRSRALTRSMSALFSAIRLLMACGRGGNDKGDKSRGGVVC
jgi:hypothetical protein